MRAFLFTLACCCIMSNNANSQNLFSYGNKNVSAAEFLTAFNKNPDTTGNRADKIKDYLTLYTNFKLKLQAALDAGLNKDENLQMESDNFKAQLAENFINQQADQNQLIQEAFTNSQKDILVQQVMVRITSPQDTFAAREIITKAYDELKSGKAFNDVTVKYSSDPATKAAQGSLGYITVFTLPYEIEKVIYALPKGGYSAIYRSSIGYHIFKYAGDRPAYGRRSFQQLLFSTPDFFTEEQKKAVAHTADSVSNAIKNGALFGSFLSTYGTGEEQYDPNTSFEISIGQYAPDFEKVVYGIAKAGDITAPFQTAYGYNIIKLDNIISVSSDINDIMNYAWLQEKIQQDGRLDKAKADLINKWFIDTKFKPASIDMNALKAYADSALSNEDGSMPKSIKGITPTTTLFEFAKQKVTVSDWLQFLQNSQVIEADLAQYQSLMEEFKKTSCNNYYRTHIEDYNPAIVGQMQEFSDANMLFAIMDKQVWSRAAEDSTGLKNYYEAQKNKYLWQPGTSAIIINASDENTITEVMNKVKANPTAWRSICESYGSAVQADSSRFEDGQYPVAQQITKSRGYMTKPEINENNNAWTMLLITDIYNTPSQRSFDEARGMVINDYQQLLEANWLTELKKKYPVKINAATLKGL